MLILDHETTRDACSAGNLPGPLSVLANACVGNGNRATKMTSLLFLGLSIGQPASSRTDTEVGDIGCLVRNLGYLTMLDPFVLTREQQRRASMGTKLASTWRGECQAPPDFPFVIHPESTNHDHGNARSWRAMSVARVRGKCVDISLHRHLHRKMVHCRIQVLQTLQVFKFVRTSVSEALNSETRWR